MGIGQRVQMRRQRVRGRLLRLVGMLGQETAPVGWCYWWNMLSPAETYVNEKGENKQTKQNNKKNKTMCFSSLILGLGLFRQAATRLTQPGGNVL